MRKKPTGVQNRQYTELMRWQGRRQNELIQGEDDNRKKYWEEIRWDTKKNEDETIQRAETIRWDTKKNKSRPDTITEDETRRDQMSWDETTKR